MARLPTVETFGTRPTPRSQRGVVPVRAGAPQRAVADAAGDVARITSAFAEKFEREDAEREARDLDTEYSNRLRVLQLGDGTDENLGFLNLRGQTAIDGREAHIAALEELQKTMLDRASSGRVGALVSRAFSNRLGTALNRSATHFGTQRNVANKASFEAHQAATADDAAVLGASGDTEGVLELATLAGAQAAAFAQQTGADPGFETDAAITSILISEIERRAIDDPASAREFFEEHRGDIDGRQHNAIEIALDRAERQANRLALADLKRDAKTALDFGRATGGIAGDVEQRLRAAGEPEEADDFARQLSANIEVHDTVEGLALATPTKINEWAEAHRPAETERATSDQAREFLTKQAIFQEVRKGIVANRKALVADPAGFVLRDPVVQTALETAQEAPNDPALAQRAALVSLDAQERAGLPESDRRVLTASQARAQVAQIEDPETGARGQAQIINGLAELYGPQFRKVYQDLVREGLSEGRQVLASLGDSPLTPVLARGLDNGDKTLIDALGTDGPDIFKNIEDGVRQSLAEYTETIFNADKNLTGRAVPFTEGIIKGVTTLALALTAGGEDENTAIERATDAILSQYEFQDGYRVPVEFSPNAVAQTATQTLLDLEDLNIAPAFTSSDLPDDIILEATLQGIRDNHFWVTSEDETGLVLMISDNRGFKIVTNRDGERIEVKFEGAIGFLSPPAEDTFVPGS